ncbi:MAG: hypothetical protein A3G32_02000 [Deltaproteobacteria bacterium RIFCSPLOWO2_12_FULL_40_28]|nr:MAG: hypothetical protein A3C45_06745 [Deltaproteobacteria bacterium RIFCSPHIGHO2_02_FULL_40_28]OGQ18902.1 MAG: hypothetical protein A3E27_09380 [Deltaproteobacteria bacterium RIFCSPHIGHO2_12_FULL_40_32]OGQ40147.1 MAG: hypothetical protein A3I69_01910 [Deltaproteobacteria bacterium RIFCSPLOWO2_02_FULL_40_36]OGQ53330.1 MAG: hypothetical protein A3G32_02000 [Deltaproteobacteria bacterium RIFCSPLOWO2_12_FULL_40_28]
MKLISKFRYFLLLFPVLFFLSCGSGGGGSGTGEVLGGTEAGNPPALRTITGTVAQVVGGALLTPQAAVVANCTADTLTVTDTAASEANFQIEDDCTFTLSLAFEKAYSIIFIKGSNEYQTIFHNNNTALSEFYFVLSSDSETMNLDVVFFVGSRAFPTNEPAIHNDQDQDGTNDFDDTDDDNDGTLDTSELDCDLDDIPNDYDLETSICDDDADADGIADAVDTDDDDDGIPDDGDASGSETDTPCNHYTYSYDACDDNCRTTSNATQIDLDFDGTGDACE